VWAFGAQLGCINLDPLWADLTLVRSPTAFTGTASIRFATVNFTFAGVSPARFRNASSVFHR
jgi:hypothetical protein